MAHMEKCAAILGQRELAVAHFKHVGIVPVAGAGIGFEALLLAEDGVDAVPVGIDVAGGAPQVAAQRGRPLPDRIPAVLAEREDDRPAGGLQRLAHLVVGGDHEAHLRGLVVGRLLLHDRFDEAAQVVLQVVDAPRGVHLCVLLLVAQ